MKIRCPDCNSQNAWFITTSSIPVPTCKTCGGEGYIELDGVNDILAISNKNAIDNIETRLENLGRVIMSMESQLSKEIQFLRSELTNKKKKRGLFK